MSGKRSRQQREQDPAPDWTPPDIDPPPTPPQVITGPPPGPTPPVPPPRRDLTIEEMQQVAAQMFGYKDAEQLQATLDKTKELADDLRNKENENKALRKEIKGNEEVKDDEQRREADKMIAEGKQRVDAAKQQVELAQLEKTLEQLTTGSNNPTGLAFLLNAIQGGKKDDGAQSRLENKLDSLQQQIAAADKKNAEIEAKHARELDEERHARERAEDKHAQELKEMQHAQERAEDKHAQELKEMQRAREQETAEQRHGQELASLQNGLMQQLAGLQARVDAAGSRPPGALGAIGEIKQMITDANNLKAALKDLGLSGGEGGKDSLAGAMVDKLLGSVMKLAKSAGIENWLSGVTGGGQQAAGPPPAPEDRPPTQDEFDQAALEWFKAHGSTVLSGQVKMNDDGFLMGNGPEIQTYLNAVSRLPGLQPYIMNDGHYMIPPDKAKAYLDWVRNITNQQQGSAPPPKKKGDTDVRPGF